MLEQRLAIAEGRLTLLCYAGAGWQVWIDGKQDFDGVRIGSGLTREEALEEAVGVLLEGVRALRALAAPAVENGNGASELPARPPDFGSA